MLTFRLGTGATLVEEGGVLVGVTITIVRMDVGLATWPSAAASGAGPLTEAGVLAGTAVLTVAGAEPDELDSLAEPQSPR